ncbi:unnamed protein product [Clonostachys rosea]|uniref:Ketoreductase (KR) domain-containing protein n=1 Tax=Bionectria ochroleuca TaxID=29856 RepID=A0ABY6UGJ6_BIOOC|nr:unnamed protein product [Clonostachys rosea]
MLSGANCACVDLSFDACKSAIEDVFAAVLHETGSEPGKMHAYACNAVVEKEVEATVAQVVRDFGQIDVLVTCAGICINGSAEETDLATWRKVIQVNLDGTYLFASIVGKHMLEQKVKGSMILVSSAGATHPPRPQHQASYNASKSGVNALAVSLATEWADRGIRVNTFSPGFMTTPLMSETSGQGNSQAPLTDIQKQWLTQIPMG